MSWDFSMKVVGYVELQLNGAEVVVLPTREKRKPNILS